MTRPKKPARQEFSDKLASLIETEEIQHAMMKGKLNVLCDHEKGKFWFERCPSHLWDLAITEIQTVTGYSPIDA